MFSIDTSHYATQILNSACKLVRNIMEMIEGWASANACFGIGMEVEVSLPG